MAQAKRATTAFAAIGAVMLVASCSPHPGTGTYKYLREVGLVRRIVDTDDRKRIPSLMRGLEYRKLLNVAARMGRYRQTVSKIRIDGVDIESVEFSKSFMALLGSYERVCADTAELLGKAESARREGLQPGIPNPAFKEALVNAKGDTIAIVSFLTHQLESSGEPQGSNAQPIEPLLTVVRADLDGLRRAKKVVSDASAKLKVDLVEKYPDYDWTLPEILPK